MKTLTDTEMQRLTGGADSPPLADPAGTALIGAQLASFLDSLAQKQRAASLAWLRTHAN